MALASMVFLILLWPTSMTTLDDRERAAFLGFGMPVLIILGVIWGISCHGYDRHGLEVRFTRERIEVSGSNRGKPYSWSEETSSYEGVYVATGIGDSEDSDRKWAFAKLLHPNDNRTISLSGFSDDQWDIAVAYGAKMAALFGLPLLRSHNQEPPHKVELPAGNKSCPPL